MVSETSAAATAPVHDITTKKSSSEHIDVVDEASIKHYRDEENLDKFGAVIEIDPVEKALVKKIDLYMMPILWLMYFLNFLDRNAMINGKLNNLDKDLKMKGTQYNTCVSIFFVG